MGHKDATSFEKETSGKFPWPYRSSQQSSIRRAAHVLKKRRDLFVTTHLMTADMTVITETASKKSKRKSVVTHSTFY